MAGEVPIPDEAWQAADDAPNLPVAPSELKLIVRAAAPYIDRAARIDELTTLSEWFERHPVQQWTGAEIVECLRDAARDVLGERQ